jgi:hypothetical protein
VQLLLRRPTLQAWQGWARGQQQRLLLLLLLLLAWGLVLAWMRCTTLECLMATGAPTRHDTARSTCTRCVVCGVKMHLLLGQDTAEGLFNTGHGTSHSAVTSQCFSDCVLVYACVRACLPVLLPDCLFNYPVHAQPRGCSSSSGVEPGDQQQAPNNLGESKPPL